MFKIGTTYVVHSAWVSGSIGHKSCQEPTAITFVCDISNVKYSEKKFPITISLLAPLQWLDELQWVQIAIFLERMSAAVPPSCERFNNQLPSA